MGSSITVFSPLLCPTTKLQIFKISLHLCHFLKPAKASLPIKKKRSSLGKIFLKTLRVRKEEALHFGIFLTAKCAILRRLRGELMDLFFLKGEIFAGTKKSLSNFISLMELFAKAR